MGSSEHASVGWCAGRSLAPFFCADFDEGPLTQGWSGLSTEHGGAGTIDDALARSPPNSFLAETTPDNSKAGTIAKLFKSFAIPFNEARFEFDFLAHDAADAYIASVTTSGRVVGAGYYVSLQGHGGGRVAQIQERMPEEATDSYADLSMPLPVGQWTHVSMVLHLPEADAGASGWLTIAFDGFVALSRHPVTSSGAWGAPAIDLGPSAESTWQAHFDNVTFDVQ
jgi:hypothetical protein